MEQELTAGECEGQIAECVEEDEVEARQMIGDAALVAASGTSLFLIAKLLGHSQMRTTQRYAHLTEHPLRMAAESTSSEIAAALMGK